MGNRVHSWNWDDPHYYVGLGGGEGSTSGVSDPTPIEGAEYRIAPRLSQKYFYGNHMGSMGWLANHRYKVHIKDDGRKPRAIFNPTGDLEKSWCWVNPSLKFKSHRLGRTPYLLNADNFSPITSEETRAHIERKEILGRNR